ALGRFISRDPNETALPILEAMAMNGEALLSLVGAFDAESHYLDGMNLYAYVNSNPINRTDPLGLSDWDEEVDSFTADWTGQRMYALGMINKGARWASIGLKTALSIASSFLPGAGLYDAFNSVQVVANGGGGFWDAFNIAMAAFPVAKAAGAVVGLGGMFKAIGYVRRACNSFVGGTMVETPDGPKLIELVEEGDVILTRPADQPDGPVIAGRVSGVFRNLAPAILWLTLSTGEIIGVTPTHEFWTYECGWTLAGDLQAGETVTGLDGQPMAIVSIVVDARPAPVYNLEVDGTLTFFAQGVWVHNNKCGIIAKAINSWHHALPKFLGGDLGGLTVKMRTVLHEKMFHPELLRRLSRAGIKRGSGTWAKYFEAHPEKAEEAVDVLLDVSRDFERNFGHMMDGSLTQAIWNQLMAEGKVLAP
ncbi:MAG TPA: polymorphic toxin-type HINT domain-containing protein, partial [Sedimentisphaerales bacterium]|nr:polymorphic toxin-type HINT domain-containing protein [Sedimentisphaerales bacterium]